MDETDRSAKIRNQRINSPDPTAHEPLTPKELEILRLLSRLFYTNLIAREAAIAPNTVKVHLRRIFRKLGVARRADAIFLARRRGYVTGPDSSLEHGTTSEHQWIGTFQNELSGAPDRLTLMPVTPNELVIIQMLQRGMRDRAIALEASITQNTVKVRLRRLFQKLGVSNRQAAVAVAILRGLIGQDSPTSPLNGSEV